MRKAGRAVIASPGPSGQNLPFGVAESRIRAYIRPMHGFIYFNITDHARLPARFFGMTRSILARL